MHGLLCWRQVGAVFELLLAARPNNPDRKAPGVFHRGGVGGALCEIGPDVGR
jgi:hypothetical protein